MKPTLTSFPARSAAAATAVDLRAADPGRLLDQHVRACLQRGDRELREPVVRGRDDHDVGREREQRVEAVHGRAERARGLGHDVEAPDQLVLAERFRALAADQAAAHDGDPQSRSSPIAPWKSKAKRSSVTPAARIAWRVSSGREA